MPTSIDLAMSYRMQILRMELASTKRLIRAYGGIFSRLEPRIQLLLKQLETGDITKTGLMRLGRYKTLIEETTREMMGFEGILVDEIESAALAAIKLGEKAGRGLISAAIIRDETLAGTLNKLSTDSLVTLLGFLDPTGPLYDKIRLFSPLLVDGITAALVDGISLGRNPVVTARIIHSKFGMNLSSAINMTSTAQLYSFRESNRASFMANSNVVEGWLWHANLRDNRTCMSCIAQHGSIHPLSERLNDHHRGRCAMVPIVPGVPIQDQLGPDWFKELPEARQKQLMSPGKFSAWKDGKFKIEDMISEYKDDVYGTMKTEKSLGELLGIKT